MQYNHFSRLYFLNELEGLDLQKYLNKVKIPQISDNAKAECDKAIIIDEIPEAVRSLANDKNPGSDGNPCEFYKTFWSQIVIHFHQSFQTSFLCGELGSSQKQGVVHLIPKKTMISQI